MKTKSIVVCIAVAVFGFGGVVVADAAEQICASFEVSSVEAPQTFGVGKYSAVATSDIIVHVVFPQTFKEDHVITLRFSTPNRHLYREIDVPIAPAGTRLPGTRRLANYPYPVEVKVPEEQRINGETVASVQVRFPVGGTSIATSSLYGAWTVNGLIDGKETRCFRPLTINIFE